MQMAYARGADRIWVVNVGDLKPLEIPINHFLDMAYDAERWGIDSTAEWAAAWAAREFAPDLANDIADVMAKYGMYASRRKFELIEPESYSVINYDEADAVLAQWAQLAEQAQTLYGKLSSDDQPAFFQMILHPILAGQTVNGIYVGAAKNQLYAGQKRNAANAAIHNVLRLSNEDANLTIRWNQMLGGKWEHMMDRKSALSPLLLSPRPVSHLLMRVQKRILATTDTGSSPCGTRCPP